MTSVVFPVKLGVIEMNFRNKKENPSQKNVKALKVFFNGSGCGVDLWTLDSLTEMSRKVNKKRTWSMPTKYELSERSIHVTIVFI